VFLRYHSLLVSRSQSQITMPPARSQPTLGRLVPLLPRRMSSWSERAAGAAQWRCAVLVEERRCVARGVELPRAGHMEERQCVAHVGALLRAGHTVEQRCVDRVEKLPCAAHVGQRLCGWVLAITAAFGTAPRGGTGGAGGGHMA
jgi:hypothetical protein